MKTTLLFFVLCSMTLQAFAMEEKVETKAFCDGIELVKTSGEDEESSADFSFKQDDELIGDLFSSGKVHDYEVEEFYHARLGSKVLFVELLADVPNFQYGDQLIS